MSMIYKIGVLLTCLYGGLQAMEEAFPLHDAARAGDVDRVRSLLDGNADPNARDLQRYTPLYLASRKVDAPVVSLLLDRGADVDMRVEIRQIGDRMWEGDTNETPLAQASGLGHSRVVKLLLDHGANPNFLVCKQTGPRHFPLDVTISGGDHAECVKLLLDHKVDVRGRYTCEKYALEEKFTSALHFSRPRTVELLLKYGAVMDQCRPGETPLTVSVQRNGLRTVEVLLIADPLNQGPALPIFPFNLFSFFTRQESPRSAQDRITMLQCLCTFPKARGKVGSFSCLSKEQQLSPLPTLPAPLQDLIISYLPEDIHSPRLLARVCKHLYTTHPERVKALVDRIGRLLFIDALKKDGDSSVKRGVVDLITQKARRRADDLCIAEHEVYKKNPERYRSLDRPEGKELKQLLLPADTDGERAELIRRKIEKEFKQQVD